MALGKGMMRKTNMSISPRRIAKTMLYIMAAAGLPKGGDVGEKEKEGGLLDLFFEELRGGPAAAGLHITMETPLPVL